MNDLRAQLPECPLEYEVPLIPGDHTALVIPVNATDIDWQEKMLPWTLASLINNTDLVMKGVHLYIACEAGTEDRIKTAISNFAFPSDLPVIIKRDTTEPFITFGEHGYRYDSVCLWDINYWAFRGDKNQIKLPLGHILKHNYGWGVADYSLHSENFIETKSAWLPLEHLKRRGIDTPTTQVKLTQYFMDAGKRTRWLHDANTAVYGEDYEKKKNPPNVATYLFNSNDEPNWHLDASILQYHAAEIIVHQAAEWFTKWQHLGTDACLALYLLKTKQHAYNLRDSVMIERYPEVIADKAPNLPFYPRLCNMKSSSILGFRHAIKQLMGAQLAMKI